MYCRVVLCDSLQKNVCSRDLEKSIKKTDRISSSFQEKFSILIQIWLNFIDKWVISTLNFTKKYNFIIISVRLFQKSSWLNKYWWFLIQLSMMSRIVRFLKIKSGISHKLNQNRGPVKTQTPVPGSQSYVWLSECITRHSELIWTNPLGVRPIGNRFNEFYRSYDR